MIKRTFIVIGWLVLFGVLPFILANICDYGPSSDGAEMGFYYKWLLSLIVIIGVSIIIAMGILLILIIIEYIKHG